MPAHVQRINEQIQQELPCVLCRLLPDCPVAVLMTLHCIGAEYISNPMHRHRLCCKDGLMRVMPSAQVKAMHMGAQNSSCGPGELALHIAQLQCHSTAIVGLSPNNMLQVAPNNDIMQFLQEAKSAAKRSRGAGAPGARPALRARGSTAEAPLLTRPRLAGSPVRGMSSLLYRKGLRRRCAWLRH